jgi:serine/threonine protein kinase
MIRWLADGTLDHLRDVAEWPDLGSRYELKGRLGRGGMGAVYVAYDRTLEREVAVKVLDRSQPDDRAIAQLQNEAKILARLEHPGIVPVHDAGALSDGRVFYVMKRVRGAPLNEALAADASTGQRLDVFLRICDAVAFAHAQGVVHRDLKPDNVMLGAFGEVLVMDWGIAASLADGGVSAVVAGTPGFMPPEQAAGAAGADARADVFALGALLEVMLPGAFAPFGAAQGAPSLGRGARALAAIARRARATNPADRYGSVDALAKEVERFRDGDPVQAYRESLIERLARVYARYRIPIILVAVYMVVRVILLLWLRV